MEKQAAAIVSRVRTEYADAGARIVALLAELDAAEEAVREINHKLAAAGRHDDALPAIEEPRVIVRGGNAEHVASALAPSWYDGWMGRGSRHS